MRWKSYGTTSFLAAFLASTVYAAPPEIEGPTSYPPYKLVTLKAKVDSGTSTLWKVKPLDPDSEGKVQAPTIIDWASEKKAKGLKFVAPPGRYSVTLVTGSIVKGEDGKDTLDFDEVEKVVTIATPGPIPPTPVPPGPTPQPPGPTPDSAPIKEPGFRVMIIFEKSKSTELPLNQQTIIFGKTTRDWLKENCVKVDGEPDLRIYDPDDDLSGDKSYWREAIKLPRTKLPWVIVSNPGKGGFSGPLPDTKEEFLTLVNKYK